MILLGSITSDLDDYFANIEKGSSASADNRNLINKNSLIIGISGIVLLAIVGGIAALWWFNKEKKIVENIVANSNSATVKPDTNAPPSGMVYVPGGEFMMGSNDGDEYSRPAHKVLVKSFFIDITETTNEEYKKFIEVTNYKTPPDWKNGSFPEGKAKFPVVGIDWDAANAFAKWAGKRLPTEEEWEFAARN